MTLWLFLAACADPLVPAQPTDPASSDPVGAGPEGCGLRPPPVPPGCNGLVGDECAANADCDAVPGGACVAVPYQCVCVYDECRFDADCGPNAVCGCASDPAYSSPVDVCVPAECQSDADCASGRCQPSVGMRLACRAGIVGWYCATVADGCESDADCDYQRCIFDSGDQSFGCDTLPYCF